MLTDTEDLTGQWFGKTIGRSGDAFLTVNVEPRSPETGLQVGMDLHTGLRVCSQLEFVREGERSFKGKASHYHVYDPWRDELVRLPSYYQRNKIDAVPTSQANFNASFNGVSISGDWEDDLGEKGTFEIWKSFSHAVRGKPAVPCPAPEPISWEDFKKDVVRFRSKGRILFRGQHSNVFPLRTSFHRTSRCNLFLYMRDELTRLRHQINAVSTHMYEPDGQDVLGLLSLAQHHGFPTPLLDWTESPYVAAFFAFDCMGNRESWQSGRPPVRVFSFDLEKWRNAARPLAQAIKDPWPDFQFMHPPAHNNPRYYPQQSMAAFSNVDNIEDFVSTYEEIHQTKYLTRIDILASEREKVEDDLRFMGITPATLFPGIDGICKSLRAELF